MGGFKWKVEGMSKGKKASESKKRRATAYHEAGHLAACHLLNIAVDSATIFPSREGIAGYAWSEGLDWLERFAEPSERPEIARRHIIAEYAGLVAERVVDAAARWNGGARGDYAKARELAARFGLDAAKLRNEAHALIHAHWPLVKVYADALLNAGTLQADALVDVAMQSGVDAIVDT